MREWTTALQGARGSTLGVWAQLTEDGGHSGADWALGSAQEVLAVHMWVSLHEQE